MKRQAVLEESGCSQRERGCIPIVEGDGDSRASVQVEWHDVQVRMGQRESGDSRYLRRESCYSHVVNSVYISIHSGIYGMECGDAPSENSFPRCPTVQIAECGGCHPFGNEQAR